LLDSVPKDLDLNAAKDAIEAVPGVESVHHLHAWSLTKGKNILSAHVLVEQYPESEPILQRIQSVLRDDFQIYFSTIQIESEVCPEIEQAEEIDFLRQPATPSNDEDSHQMHH
jgi:cobalt-zinc-cadmium efflux system protein